MLVRELEMTLDHFKLENAFLFALSGHFIGLFFSLSFTKCKMLNAFFEEHSVLVENSQHFNDLQHAL